MGEVSTKPAPTQVFVVGEKGITPLHMAAISKSGAGSAHLLTSYGNASQWTSCITQDGLSPSDFARMAGNSALDAEMKALIRLQRCASDSQPIPVSSDSGRQLDKFNLLEKCSSPANSSSSKDTAICLDFGRSRRESTLVGWSDDESSDSDCDCR